MTSRFDKERVVKPGFNEKVYRAAQSIPKGHVVTYGDIATYLGSPRVARHVGWALSALPEASSGKIFNNHSVPWYRVINAKGRVSARDDILRGQLQLDLLAAEGVEISSDGKIDLNSSRWILSR